MTHQEEVNAILMALYDYKEPGKLMMFDKYLDNNRSKSRSIGDYLKSKGLVQGRVVTTGFAGLLTSAGRIYVEEELLNVDKESYSRKVKDGEPKLTMRKKYDIILRKLYDLRTGYHEISLLLKEYQDTTLGESIDIAQALKRKGLVRSIGSKEGASVEITAEGREYVEENIISISSYDPSDKFTSTEISKIEEKLDELLLKIGKLEMGQEIIHDTFEEEFEVLKQLLNVLGKKDWKQMLFGKLVDAGLGSIAEKVLDTLGNVFQDQKLLG